MFAMPSSQADKGKQFRDMGRAATSGTLIVASVLVGYFVGTWLDAMFHTAPTLMAIGVLLGMVAGIVELV